MKARVKATGEIVEVREEYDPRGEEVQVFYSNEEDPHEVYEKEELDFDVKENSFPKDDLDYWTRLEHQYAGMAMQGMLNNSYLAGEFRKDPNNGIEDMSKIITKAAAVYAHALVEKMKEANR